MSVTVKSYVSKYHGHTIEVKRVKRSRGFTGWLAKVDGEHRTVQPTKREALAVARGYVDAPKSGDCYDAAIVTAEDLIGENDADTVFVCHGRPTGQGPIEGVIHGHAWVEVEQRVEIPDDAPDELKRAFAGHTIVWVHDRSNGKDLVYPAALYYNAGRIDPDEVARYSLDDAYLNMEEFGHYGPWDE